MLQNQTRTSVFPFSDSSPFHRSSSYLFSACIFLFRTILTMGAHTSANYYPSSISAGGTYSPNGTNHPNKPTQPLISTHQTNILHIFIHCPHTNIMYTSSLSPYQLHIRMIATADTLNHTLSYPNTPILTLTHPNALFTTPQW